MSGDDGGKDRRRDAGGPRLTGRAKEEREARARRVAAEMRANLLKRKRRQRALAGGGEGDGGREPGEDPS